MVGPAPPVCSPEPSGRFTSMSSSIMSLFSTTAKFARKFAKLEIRYSATGSETIFKFRKKTE